MTFKLEEYSIIEVNLKSGGLPPQDSDSHGRVSGDLPSTAEGGAC